MDKVGSADASGLRATDNSSWSASELLERINRGENFLVLDVRSSAEFAKFHLEGRGALPIRNVPYAQMAEAGGKPDRAESVAAYMQRDLAKELPRGVPILAVCARGVTSVGIMENLQRLGFPGATLIGGMTAWGEHYATRAVVEGRELAVYQISRPARGCLSYVVASEGQAIVIDPLRHLHPYLDLARSQCLAISAVIDTHAHADHVSGGPALAAATGAKYFLHPHDAIHPVDMLPTTIPYEPVRDGQIFPVGHRKLAALHIPGHTLGLVALRLGEQFLFAGDSIFIRSLARPDLGGKAENWAPLHARSLRNLLQLPGGIRVLPGHFSALAESDEAGLFAASLDDLKARNDGLLVLQRENEAGFVRYLLASLPPFNPQYLDIKRVNAGLLAPSEEEISVLELGKNACALAGSD